MLAWRVSWDLIGRQQLDAIFKLECEPENLGMLMAGLGLIS